MTLLSTLGYAPKKKSPIPVKEFINANEISIVIPVKNNQFGISRFLHIFEEITPKEFYPLEIIIIDNNSGLPIEISRNYPVKLRLSKCKPVGPASARNKGVEISKGQWILFTDSDCIPTESSISGYCRTDNKVI
ncbi:glycosyltransferase, partial [Wenyingzhuangia sp. 1_MG-2023]|nr:glycosyltransferase [Wenyingzhuangia sp. 1_MG-2023]